MNLIKRLSPIILIPILLLSNSNHTRSQNRVEVAGTEIYSGSSNLSQKGGEGKYKKPAKPMKYWTKEEFREWEKYSEMRIKSLKKPTAHEDRNFGLHDGNKLRTLFYNYGSIGRPNTEPSIEWPIYSGHGYGYEFGIIVGAEVVDIYGDTVHIFSDGMLDGGDTDPAGGVNVWGWEPLPGYGVSTEVFNSWPQVQKDKGGIAMSNRPETWGELFPSDEEGNLLWPGQYGPGVITADLESYYVMDDRWNKEFEYYPFVNDSSRRGLGIQVTARGYQYAASIAEDIIFFQFEVTNVSDKRLDKVIVGMIGDPHIGGAGDFSDDFFGYDKEKNLVYSWDNVGSSNDYGIPWEEVGWLGFMFLESPGNYEDGIDNDKDGIIDERRDSGPGELITDQFGTHWSGDEDGDWNSTDKEAMADTAELDIFNGIDDDGDGRIDDLGDLDGKSDDLNGNGIPDPGEPDFDATDIDESDQMGLTSMSAPIYATKEAWMDDVMWEEMIPGRETEPAQNADNIIIFGSGYFALDPGQTEKFSIAIVMGQNEDDMRANADVGLWIYKLNFQFTKPPDPPNVWAVAGDGKVTLYWDDTAEKSVDPVFGKDFEGYKIYRSTDKIHWGEPITDNKGIKIMETPIAQFDLIDDVEGTHPIEFAGGLHFNTGKNTGLVHSYVDSNLVNGITYYYAVTAYDRGSVEGKVPPFESSKIIGGPNVVEVTPNAPAAGFEDAKFIKEHVSGYSTAILEVKIINRTLIDGSTFEITFDDTSSIETTFSIRNYTATDTVIIWEDLPVSYPEELWNERFNFGPFEGRISDVKQISVDSVKWMEGKGVFNLQAALFAGGSVYQRDVEIRFYDQIKDTSVLVNPQPIKFAVWNANDEIKMDVVFFDNDNNGQPTLGDKIVPVIYQNNVPRGTWEVGLLAPTDTTISDTVPEPGSVIKVYVSKPFESIDKYVVNTIPAKIDRIKAKEQMNRIAVVPNPYVAASSFEVPPPEVFTVGRGERRVDFIHLPKDAIIRIYTITGEHIKTIEHHGTIYDGTESWDLLNKEGLDIAPGIYIYHVEAPGIGQKIGRIAIIK